MNKKLFVEINGIKQGMFLQSNNVENPVLLFLHGGPGSPEIAFNQRYPSGLENIFTVCWWEQRGCGISYSGRIKPWEMTMEQMIADTIAVTHYLRRCFGKEKIYIMGHSWGSLLGVLTVQQAPELFHAYIGTGQVVKQLESERLAYKFMLQEFRRRNNKKMAAMLERFHIDKGGAVSFKYLAVRSQSMNMLGIGIMRQLTSMMDGVKVVIGFRGYTMKEKLNYARGSSLSLKYLWDYVIQTDFFKQVPELKIPIYILQGKFDYQVSYDIARQFAKEIIAPIKGFYTFEHSAHSPCFEEPEKMCKILQADVLQRQTELSDVL